MILRAVTLLAMLAASSAQSQTLEHQERRENFDKFNDAAKNVETLVEQMSRNKKIQCLKAFGSDTFCECMSQKLPVAIDFRGYVNLITHSKEELDYDKQSKEDKRIVDNARAARELCVKQSGIR